MNFSGKNIAILGAGGSGYAAAALALSCGAKASVFDSGNPEKLAPAVARFDALGAPLTCGEAALSAPGSFDFTVISPGIDSAWPIAKAFSEASGELIGEIEFAWRAAGEGRAPVIGITGTNGKTTTTSLVAEMLQAAGKKVVAAGNIGLPYCDVVRSGESHDWVVLELSSFQLETVSQFSPRIAVWMNFAPDHMDRYATLKDYFDAKFRIFENLSPDALAVHKLECELDLAGRSSRFSAFSAGGDFSYEGGAIRHQKSGRSFDFVTVELQGKHNAENVMAALAVADELGIDWELVAPAIRAFRAPAHRCEKVASLGGVLFLNDSKSTNLHSLESALNGQEEPVILIAGGKNKGLDFAELREVAGRMVRECICIGEISGHIASVWKGAVPCRSAMSVEEAVLMSRTIARPGEIVLFSPGTSSFDMFTGYEARGRAFRDAVLAGATA